MVHVVSLPWITAPVSQATFSSRNYVDSGLLVSRKQKTKTLWISLEILERRLSFWLLFFPLEILTEMYTAWKGLSSGESASRSAKRHFLVRDASWQARK